MKSRAALYLSCVLLFSEVAVFGSDWILDGNGNYSNPANWNGPVPNAPFVLANFPDIITADRVVTLDISPTVGALIFSPVLHSYTLNPPGSLTITLPASISATTAMINSGITVPISPLIINSTGIFSINGNISGVVATNLVGSGKVVLAGVNDLALVTVNSGILAVTNDGNLGAGSSLALNDNTTLQANDLSSLSRPISLGGGAVGVRIDTSGNSFNLSSSISGSGPLLKTNAGTLALSGASTYSGGTVVNEGILAITNDSNLGGGTTTLTLNAGTTLQATGASSLSSHPLSLEGSILIDTNGNPFTIASKISGPGFLTKINGGTLTLSGSNTYSGGTTLNGGTLGITNDSNLGSGGPPLTLNAGTTLQAAGVSSLSSRPITLGGSVTIDTNGNSFGIASTISGVGPLTKINTGVLTLSSSNTYDNGTTVNGGTLAITADSSLGTLAPLTLNTATLQVNNSFSLTRPIVLGGAGSVDTASHSLTIPFTISGSGPLTKIGAGTLTLSGSNTYTGSTIVNKGTLIITADNNLGSPSVSPLALNIGTKLQVDDSFSLTRPVVLAGGGDVTIDTGSHSLTIPSVISGFAHLIKSGEGILTLSGTNTYASTTTIQNGTLIVGGTVESSIIVTSGGVLKGGGSILNLITNSGTLQPGTSIGTLNVSGPVTFNSGSNYTVEISPTAASLLKVNIAGVNINPGASLIISPGPGVYLDEQIYTIIQSVGGFSGLFTNETSILPAFQPMAIYSTNVIQLIISLVPFVDIVGPSGNVGAVAAALDEITASPGSDMELVLSELLMIPTVDMFNSTFFQLQPSVFKGFAVAQETMSVAVRSAMSKRFSLVHENRCLHRTRCDSLEKNGLCSERKWTLWVDALGNFSRQKRQSREHGFHTTSGGAVVGFGYKTNSGLFLGMSGAYSYTDIDWDRHAAEGDIQSGYLNLYGTYSTSYFFIDTILTGAHSGYFGKRKIQFQNINRRARHHHTGNEVLAHVKTGGLFQLWEDYSFNPFISADYIYLHQNRFKEHGASSLNLIVKSSVSDYLRGEAGFNFNGCVKRKWGKLIPNLKFGVVREWRFRGKHYNTKISGGGPVFQVTGLNPDRTLFAPGVSLMTLSHEDRLSFSLAYDAEISKRFWDHNVNVQLGFSF